MPVTAFREVAIGQTATIQKKSKNWIELSAEKKLGKLVEIDVQTETALWSHPNAIAVASWHEN